MRLQDHLPKGVTVDGKFYRMDFDFRNVLRMMEEMQRDDLIQEAREYRALRCLTRRPRNVHRVLEAVHGMLFGEPPSGDRKKVTSFEQDAGMIRAAFWQAYRIDLYTARLHWIVFSELLQNIPEGSRYTEVIGIRARPIPKATKWNAEERQWLMKAKASVALHMSDAEQEKKYETDVGNIFQGLMSMIRKAEDAEKARKTEQAESAGSQGAEARPSADPEAEGSEDGHGS